MAKRINLPVLLVLLILSPAVLFAQGYRYPAVARLMSEDGFTKRQNGYVEHISRESMACNRLGFKAYQAKDYTLAITEFDRAIRTDKKNMFAHFNKACSLALAYGSQADKNTLNTIVDHLLKATWGDVHWIYKVFLDSDLDAVRGRLLDFDIYFPCPGDCCPDESINLHKNGTVSYSASLPDLSGMDTDTGPPPSMASGWYTIIGDNFLVYIPGRDAMLADISPMYGMEEEDGIQQDSLLRIPFTKDASGKITGVSRAW